jgi:hypothetical protein
MRLIVPGRHAMTLTALAVVTGICFAGAVAAIAFALSAR